ncbi:MAG: subfamily polymerase sigma factor, polymerase sigma-70 factor, subfamily [Parcubacteria group bacterium]|nr:subfamily polymerase sigma factor, polymerase sigma-70 factor, subfamily [Parcubacteria group bacterium]
MDPSDSTDEALAQRLQAGDEESLSLLMQRFEPKLMRYGRRFLEGQREDVLRQAVQDIFISAYQNIESFDPRQRFSPWIYRIAHNAFVDILRRRTKQPLYGIDFDQLISHPIHEDSFAAEKEQEEIRVLVEKGLGELAPAQREIIVLYYFEELSYKEIADVLHVPVSTVGVRLARARTTLKRTLPNSSELPL